MDYLKSGVAREFEVGEADTVNKDLVGADSSWGFEADRAASGDEVVLIDTVAADTEATGKYSVFIEAHCTGEKDYAALIAVGRPCLIALCARVLQVLQE